MVISGYKGGSSIVGKVSNNFGIPLNRDIDGDGDNDSAVILDNIVGWNYNLGSGITVDSNGNAYIVADSWNGKFWDVHVIKLDSNGNLDRSFGNGGKIILNNISGGNGDDVGNGIAIDNDGNIFITGNSYNGSNDDVFVVKLDSNGKLVNNFGRDGKVILSNIAGGDGHDSGYGITIDNSGNIYVTGSSYNIVGNFDAFVVKLDSNGNLDSNFGKGGKVIFDNIAREYDNSGEGIAIDSSGNVFIILESLNLNGDIIYSYVIKLDSNGNWNKGFGNGGKIILNNISGGNGDDVGNGIAIDNDGNIFITGNSYNGSNDDVFVIKIE